MPNVRRRVQATGEMFWFCLWLRFYLPQREGLNGDATIPGTREGGGDIQVKAFWSKKGIPDDIVSGCCRQMLLSDLERHVRCQ